MNTPHIVIIGASFGRLHVARQLRTMPVQITLIDRQNYHLFQPLLYQVGHPGLLLSKMRTPSGPLPEAKNPTFRWANDGNQL